MQRKDDTEEAISRRLELYERQTAPLIQHYKDRGLLASIPGTGGPDQVTKRVVKAIEDARRGRANGTAP